MHLSRKIFVIFKWSIYISTVDRKIYCPQHKILSARRRKVTEDDHGHFAQCVLDQEVTLCWVRPLILNSQGGRDENMQSFQN